MRESLGIIAARHVERLIRCGKLRKSDRRAAQVEIWRMVASREAEVVGNKLVAIKKK